MRYELRSAVANASPPFFMPVPSEPDDLPLTLRAAMRQLAGGVSLITVGTGTHRRGFTATSVTSLTLEPPCILVCVNRAVSALSRILAERRFGVSVLADHHHALAVRFSGLMGIKGAARFDEGRWQQTATGIPLLADGLAGIACDLEDTIERHSHLILVGAVHAIDLGPAGLPLVYAQGTYGGFAAFESPATGSQRGIARRRASDL